MCPGFLWFTFTRWLVTHNCWNYTASGYNTFQSKSRSQFFQQSTTLHCLLFYLSMWNELCNFFFLICLSFWLVDLFCCLLLFLCSDISKKKDVFLCKGTKNVFFQCVKSRVECWNVRLTEKKISSLAKVICKISLIFKDFLTACVMARISMLLCFSSTESLWRGFF